MKSHSMYTNKSGTKMTSIPAGKSLPEGFSACELGGGLTAWERPLGLWHVFVKDASGLHTPDSSEEYPRMHVYIMDEDSNIVTVKVVNSEQELLEFVQMSAGCVEAHLSCKVELDLPHEWEDESYGNDACAHFSIVADDHAYNLWVFEPRPEDREMEMQRFWLTQHASVEDAINHYGETGGRATELRENECEGEDLRTVLATYGLKTRADSDPDSPERYPSSLSDAGVGWTKYCDRNWEGETNGK